MEYHLENWLLHHDHWEEARAISDYVQELENRNFEFASNLLKARWLLETRNKQLKKLKLKLSALEEGRSCTCHPSEAPTPCQRKYALGDCIKSALEGK